MPPGIPTPPTPPLDVLLGTGAGCLLLGLVLLLAGRRTAKAVMALALAGAAAACAPVTARHLAYANVPVVAVASGLLGCIAGFLLARVLWALVLGAVLSAAALGLFVSLAGAGLSQPPTWNADAGGDWMAWTTELGPYALSWTAALWGYNALAVALIAGAPLAIGLALGIFYPQAMLVLVSSLLGAVLTVAGVGLGLWAIAPDLAGQVARQVLIPGLGAGLTGLSGLGLQARALLRQRAEQKPGKDKTSEPGGGGGKEGGKS